MDKFKIITKEKINDLPQTAGVYSFYEKNKIIYIGKAINIQKRVKNHINQPSYRDDLFIDKIDEIGYLKTGSEIEALILEASLIKKCQPKFNVVWRDDKNYFYVAIANQQETPYIYITHQPFDMTQGKKNDAAEYIGPFVDGMALKKTLRFLRRAFPYYTTNRHSKIKCTYCHLDLCPGPDPDLPAYKKNVKKLVLILKGKKGAVLNSLKKEMSRYARSGVAIKNTFYNKDFERAAKLRDKIYNLQQIMLHTNVINNQPLLMENSEGGAESLLSKIIGLKIPASKIECYDVSNIQGKFATGSMIVSMGGKPDKNKYKKFRIRIKNGPNDIAMLKETIERRLKHKEWQYPNVMLIDGGRAQLNMAIKIKNQNNLTKQIKVISIAKGKQELFIEKINQPIPLKTLPQKVYNLVKQLDDEAHRFAITYHKELRKKNLLR